MARTASIRFISMFIVLERQRVSKQLTSGGNHPYNEQPGEEPDRMADEPIPNTQEQNVPVRASGGWRTMRSWMRDLLVAVLVSSFIILFVYQPVKVEGSSMEPGLEDQERIFINKLVYRLENVQHGDIVVFRYPRDPRKSFIKRVIGLPGDTIRISRGHVYRNGQRVLEPYVTDDYADDRSYPETV